MRPPWGSHNWSPHLIRMVSWKYTYKILATFYLSKISTLSGNRTLRQLSWFTYWSFNWIVLTFPRLILRYSILNIEITLCSPCPWMLRKGGISTCPLLSPPCPWPLPLSPLVNETPFGGSHICSQPLSNLKILEKKYLISLSLTLPFFFLFQTWWIILIMSTCIVPTVNYIQIYLLFLL